MDEDAPPSSSSSSRKRPFFDDDDDHLKPQSKRVRFPKGKKVKLETPAEAPVNDDADTAETPDLSDPRAAAKERARRRSQLTTKLFTEDVGEVALTRISAAEVRYQENEIFVDDGIPMEPFNLEKEREEGFFDEAGNFVEYVAEKEEKDAWLDSLEVDPKLAERLSFIPKNVDEEEKELSSDDIGKMKRQIADALEPGETVLEALKRLKGRSSDKKAKMSAESQRVFDQLTENAMKLMENGDYNVYHEEREVFQREAEGYEALARARNGEEEFDMFGDEADDDVAKFEHNDETLMPDEGTSQSSGDKESQNTEGSLAEQSDYVYDEASGFYYSPSLGYYYDSSSGLFCSALSGQWYKYNDETNSYDEVQAELDVATTNDG